MSGFFVAVSPALAAANVYPASGGTDISIDTTSAPEGTATFKTLTGPSIGDNGDIAVGTHTINLPAGWEFDIDSKITITPFNNIGLESTSITPSQTSFSFVVTSQSTVAGFVGFSNLKIRPTGTTLSTGIMTYLGVGIVGVDGSTNFGTLSTVPGTVAQLAFTTQPGGAVYGSLLGPQPVVKTQDQFGNNSTNGLVATEMVSISLTGSGALIGTVSLDIGTGGGNGTVTFTDLKVGGVGAIETKGLTASAGTLIDAVSETFVISPKPLTATVTVNNKPYDGNNSAVITDVTLNDVEVGDVVTVGSQGTATFNDINAGEDIDVTATGVTITGDHAGNYDFNNIATGVADITPLEITITPTAGQTKIYGQADPTFAYDFTPALIDPDVFTGALSRVLGEDVGTYAYAIGTLENGLDNYSLILVSETFEITQKALTVTVTGVDKEYDQTTDATVTLSSVDEILGDNLVYAYTSASFSDKTAENGKTVNVGGISISGVKAGNYNLQNTEAVATANITKKPITATINVNNKTYNGDTNAVYASENPRVANGVLGDDVVVVENTGTKSFTDKHVGVGKTVNATGLILSGADFENYEFDGNGTGTATINARPITVTAAEDSKTYNGLTDSDEAPIITTGLDSDPIALGDTEDFTQTYDNKNVGGGKTLTPDGVVIDGNPTEEGSNYDVTIVPADVGTITEKSINVTAQTNTKTYDGTTDSSVVPVVDPRETGDTVDTAPTQEFDTKDVATGKTLTPSGLVIDDGFGGANYIPVYLNDTTGVIEAKELTVIGATTVEKVYDGDEAAEVDFTLHELVGIVPGEELLVSLDLSGSSATFNNKNVATEKEVTVLGLALTGAGASNYSLIQPVLNDGVITARTLTVTAITNTKTYDGLTTAAALPTITVGTLAGGDTGTFTETYDNANVGATHILTPVGTIADADDINMTENYDITFTPIATGVITKAPLTITANDQSREYGDANPILTASYVGFVGSEDKSVLDTPVLLETTAGVTSPVDDYDIVASGATDNNYEITHEDGTLTVTAAPIDIIPDEGQGKIYGEPNEEITYTATGFKNGETELLFTGALGREPGEHAGPYPINGGTLDVGGNYFIGSFSVVFYTIEQRELTVTAVTDTKVYDGTTGSVGVPTIVGDLQFGNTPGFTQSYDTEDVGDSKILTATGIVNDGNSGLNYNYTFLPDSTGVIEQLAITITPNAGQSKVFDTDDPDFTYTNTPGLISPDTFTGALSRDTGEDVGTYDYALGTLADGLDNYSLTLAGGTFEIVKATPVITWANPADIVYGAALGGTELNATADVAGAFVYAPVSGTVLNAGVGQTLSVTFTPTDTTNYNNANKDVLITVTPASLTVMADNQNKVYGTTLTFSGTEFTTSELVGGDTVTSVTLTSDGSPAAAIAADYDIVPSAAVGSGLSNYDIAYDSGTLTVEDTVDPTLLSHTPSVNAVNVAVGSSITITFSESVNVAEGVITLNPGTSFTMSGDGTNVITLTPTSVWDDNTIYMVTVTEGVEDVNGNTLTNPTSWSFTTATSYSLNFNADAGGWNLISLPVVPTDKNISAVLSGVESSVDAVWTYDPLNPNAVDGWLVYVPGNPEETNNLTIMTAGYGYWVSATGNATISGSGSLFSPQVTPPQRNLVAGWNLIGYYQHSGESESTPVAAFESLGDSYTGPFGFNNSDGAFIWPVTQILPGDAFWISLPSAKTYSPGTPNL